MSRRRRSGPQIRTANRASKLAFFNSLSEGFSGRVDRLVHLIGQSHWPSVGASREILLRDFLRDYLPRRYCVSTGFVLFDDPRVGLTPSPQIDVIVWDQLDNAPHFCAGDFVVVPPGAVELAIMVKSTLGKAEFDEDVGKLLGISRAYDTLRKAEAYQDVPTPGLLLFAWKPRFSTSGKPDIPAATAAGRLRDAVLASEQKHGAAHSYLFPPAGVFVFRHWSVVLHEYSTDRKKRHRRTVGYRCLEMNSKSTVDLTMREMLQIISLLLLDEDHQAWFRNLQLTVTDKPAKRRADLASGKRIGRFLQEGWHDDGD